MFGKIKDYFNNHKAAFIFGIIGAALLVTFISQNTEQVPIKFLVWELYISRILLMVLLVVAGWVGHWIYILLQKKKAKKAAASTSEAAG